MQVQIVGGMSTPGSITIQSADFISRARCGSDGEITYETRPAPKISQLLYKLNEYPIPRTLMLLIFLFNSLSRTTKIVLGGVLAFDLWGKFLSPETSSTPIPPVDNGFSIDQYLFQMGFYLFVLLFLKRVAPWHAAEHKVIAAYRDSGSIDLVDIENASRIDRACGGRFPFPFILGSLFAGFVAEPLSLSPLLCLLLTFEALLWIDRLVGFSNIRLTWFASRMLQTHLTTREPGLREICTAQTAMRNLIACHAEAAT